MGKTFIQQVSVSVKGDYPLIVAGGGAAGCAAALAAARLGVKTLLIEKSNNLGGLATNGLVVYYLPALNFGRDKVTGGLAEEFLRAAIRYGHNTLHPAWQNGAAHVEVDAPYDTFFSAPGFMAALEELLEDAGVTILYDSVCVDAIGAEGVCRGVVVENKEGRLYYGCQRLVDASGDADLLNRLGVPCAVDENYLSYWSLFLDLETMGKCVADGDVRQALRVQAFGLNPEGEPYAGSARPARNYTIASGEEVSDFIREGRRYFRDYCAKMDKKREMAVSVPAQANFRTTRRLLGEVTLDEKDIGRRAEDSVGCLAGRAILEIPYRALIRRGYPNVLTAGRTISALGTARELTRLIGGCAVTGQAAGTAAALSLRADAPVYALETRALQDVLRQNGAILRA